MNGDIHHLSMAINPAARVRFNLLERLGLKQRASSPPPKEISMLQAHKQESSSSCQPFDFAGIDSTGQLRASTEGSVVALAASAIALSDKFNSLDRAVCDLEDRHVRQRPPRPQEPERAQPIAISVDHQPDGSFTLRQGPTKDPEFDAALQAHAEAVVAWEAKCEALALRLGIAEAKARRDEADEQLRGAVKRLADARATTAVAKAAKAQTILSINPDMAFSTPWTEALTLSLLRDTTAVAAPEQNVGALRTAARLMKAGSSDAEAVATLSGMLVREKRETVAPNKDPVVAMWERAQQLTAIMNAPGCSDEASDAAFDEYSALDGAILETRPTSADGAIASLEWLRHQLLAHYFTQPDEGPLDTGDVIMLALIDNALGFLRADNGLAAGNPVVGEPDPIFDVIKLHREAIRHTKEDFRGDTPEIEQAFDAAVQGEAELWRQVSITEPRSIPGIAAAIVHASDYANADIFGAEDTRDMIQTLANACRQLIPAQTDSPSALATSVSKQDTSAADPIYAAIGAHKEAIRHAVGDFEDDSPEGQHAFDEAVIAEVDAWVALSTMEPATADGLCALAAHVADYAKAEPVGGAEYQNMAANLAKACKKLIPRSSAAGMIASASADGFRLDADMVTATLPSLSISALHGAYDAFRNASDAFAYVELQSRYYGDSDNEPPALMHAEYTRCGLITDAIAAEAERRIPSTKADREARATLLTIHNLNCGSVRGAARTLAELKLD